MRTTNQNEIIIDIRQLYKAFPKPWLMRRNASLGRTYALEDITFHVRRNEIFGLLGANGAGKTTLIKILCTLVRPTSGQASVCGYEVERQGAQVRRRIGLVNCDDRSHFWRLSARENLRFYAALNNVPRERTEYRIDELLELTGLRHAADVWLSDFSAGMKQRLAIARGLLSDPEVLFMDEPSRSLDPLGAYEVRSFIRERVVQHAGRTVILATNLMDEASFLCDRMALIRLGRLEAMGTTSELKYALSANDRYRLTVRGWTTAAHDAITALPDVIGVELTQLDDGATEILLTAARGSAGLPQAIRALVEAGCDIWRCEPLEYSLDDVFRAVMSGGTRPNSSATAETPSTETRLAEC